MNNQAPLTAQALIEVKDLSFKRGERVIYDQVNLKIRQGQITGIMGPSGTGKTTLLRLIGGQLTPDQGEVLFDGQNIAKMSRKELFAARARMGMLFQSGALFTDMSVYENVAFPIRAHTKLPEHLLSEIISLKLESVGLRGAEQMMPSELSGGMNRRVALARAIALDPELIMYDEPFAGQDPITMAVLVKLIRELNQSLGITSVIVSHDVAEVMSIADHVYLIANHQIVAQGSPEELRREGNPEVVQFVQGLPDGPVPFHYPAIELLQEL